MSGLLLTSSNRLSSGASKNAILGVSGAAILILAAIRAVAVLWSRHS